MLNKQELFKDNTDHQLLSQSLSLLQTQLELAHHDLSTLQAMKERALSDPDKMISDLLSDRFPLPNRQAILKIPHIDVSAYANGRGYTAGGGSGLHRPRNGRYEQNLAYFLERIQAISGATFDGRSESEMAIGRSDVGDETTMMIDSLEIPLEGSHDGFHLNSATNTGTSSVDPVNPERQTNTPWPLPTIIEDLESVRKRFRDAVAMGRALSAPSTLSFQQHRPKSISRIDDGGNDAGSNSRPSQLVGDRGDLLSPQPQASRQFSVTFLSGTPPSSPPPLQQSPPEAQSPTHPSPTTATTKKGTHHNLPWTPQECLLLTELLETYPPEAVSTRRYAKISAALGTRTPSQVSNRLGKLAHRRQKQHSLDDSGSAAMDLDDDGEDDVRMNVFKCDACGMDPIMGDCHQCIQCTTKTKYSNSTNGSLDLCTDCHANYSNGNVIGGSGIHKASHQFKVIPPPSKL